MIRFNCILINKKKVDIHDIETISLDDFRVRLENCGAGVKPEDTERVFNKVKELCEMIKKGKEL